MSGRASSFGSVIPYLFRDAETSIHLQHDTSKHLKTTKV